MLNAVLKVHAQSDRIACDKRLAAQAASTPQFDPEVAAVCGADLVA
jgi:hypothetical protein